MKRALLLLLIVALAGPTHAQKRPPQEKDMGAYLMVYHKDQDHGLHMAISYDGYAWRALNADRPVIAGDTIARQRGIRDPHIFRGPDGLFYLAMTDLHIYAQREGYRTTEWERDGERYGWGNNQGLVLMRSADLIHWQRSNIQFTELSDSLREVGCVWAPETTYDYQKHKLVIYYTMRYGTAMNKLYYSYVSDDYTRLETLPQVLFEYPKEGISAIDGDITYADGVYHLMYCSHERTPGIKQATSASVYGPWTYDDQYYDTEDGACEAPHVFKRIGERKWVLMYDIYSVTPHNFGFAETTDWKHFTDLGHFDGGRMSRTGFAEQKHGAVCWLTKREARRLERFWKAHKSNKSHKSHKSYKSYKSHKSHQ